MIDDPITNKQTLSCFSLFLLVLTHLHSEWPKLYGAMAVLSAIGLKCLHLLLTELVFFSVFFFLFETTDVSEVLDLPVSRKQQIDINHSNLTLFLSPIFQWVADETKGPEMNRKEYSDESHLDLFCLHSSNMAY